MYYIKRRGDKNWDSEFESNQLGEISFSTFWANAGFNTLKRNIERSNTAWLEHIEIFDDQLNIYSIEDFLDIIKKCNIVND